MCVCVFWRVNIRVVLHPPCMKKEKEVHLGNLGHHHHHHHCVHARREMSHSGCHVTVKAGNCAFNLRTATVSGEYLCVLTSDDHTYRDIKSMCVRACKLDCPLDAMMISTMSLCDWPIHRGHIQIYYTTCEISSANMGI